MGSIEMRRFSCTVFLIIIGLVSEASAHVSNIATFILAEDDKGWRLDVYMPTDGMHQAIQRIHPDEPLSDIEVKAYENYVEAALRDGIELSYDQIPVPIGVAHVSLAPHETRVSFMVPKPHARATMVNAHIDALHQRGDQNNVFRLITKSATQHIVLKADNNFRGSLALVAPMPMPMPMPNNNWPVSIGVLLAIGTILVGATWLHCRS